MGDNRQKTGCSRSIIAACTVLYILFSTGCGDFFAQKPSELHSKAILSELEQIRPVSDPNIGVPYIYKEPPAILETKKGVRLFYFTQHHTVDKLAGLIKEQLGYVVSQSPATNQLIIDCPNPEEAQITLEFLGQIDVPPIQVKIDCIISELYADLTMDRETTLKIQNLFGENINLGGKEVWEKAGSTFEKVLRPAFPGASLRDEARELIGLKVGYTRNLGVEGHEFKALVDLLVSRGYLKILMNPTLEVVNGETAQIEARDFVPLPKEVEVVSNGLIYPYMTTEYQWVVDSLEITPHAFADGYIGLETTAQIGSKSTPEGVKQIPIITERKVTNKENRIRHGESLIIGGIRKSEERDVIRGVPVLKDVPILGLLFSSRDFEERAKEIIFIITPTISTGGMPNEKMVENIRKKHEPPSIFDVLDTKNYENEQQPGAEQTRLKTETEKARVEAEKVELMLKDLNNNLNAPEHEAQNNKSSQ